MATIQTERQMLKPLYACTVAESILMWPRTKKAWSPKIGGNDLELARWSLTYRYGMECVRFCILEPRPQCLLVELRVGDSIPISRDNCLHIASLYRDDGDPYIASQYLASTELKHQHRRIHEDKYRHIPSP